MKQQDSAFVCFSGGQDSTTCLFRTGREPGIPVQTGQVWVFGSAPNAVEQPQNIFVLVASST